MTAPNPPIEPQVPYGSASMPMQPGPGSWPAPPPPAVGQLAEWGPRAAGLLIDAGVGVAIYIVGFVLAFALYAALLEAGVLKEDELETYGADDSRLPMSGMATYTPGMEISGGSLGQGRGSGRVEWLRTLGEGWNGGKSNLRLHVQLFSGYGDSLIDYNYKRTVLSVGFSLLDF